MVARVLTRVESHGGPGEEVGALAGPDTILLRADHWGSRDSAEVKDGLRGGDSVGGCAAVLAQAGLVHVGQLEGELVSGQAGDGDARLGGEEEAGGPVPGQVDLAGSDDTAEQSDLQSGGVDCPGVLDTNHGRLHHHQGCVALTPTVPCPAGVDPGLAQCEGAQQEAPIPASLHLHWTAGLAPGQDRPGVAGAGTLELGQGPGGGRQAGGTPGDLAGGGEQDLVGLDHWPASIVHQALVDPGISRPHLQHLQHHRARHQPDCEENCIENISFQTKMQNGHVESYLWSPQALPCKIWNISYTNYQTSAGPQQCF